MVALDGCLQDGWSSSRRTQWGVQSSHSLHWSKLVNRLSSAYSTVSMSTVVVLSMLSCLVASITDLVLSTFLGLPWTPARPRGSLSSADVRTSFWKECSLGASGRSAVCRDLAHNLLDWGLDHLLLVHLVSLVELLSGWGPLSPNRWLFWSSIKVSNNARKRISSHSLTAYCSSWTKRVTGICPWWPIKEYDTRWDRVYLWDRVVCTFELVCNENNNPGQFIWLVIICSSLICSSLGIKF